jgi:hypothetical protein
MNGNHFAVLVRAALRRKTPAYRPVGNSARDPRSSRAVGHFFIPRGC